MTMEKNQPTFEGVSPSKNGDVPACHVSLEGFHQVNHLVKPTFELQHPRSFPTARCFTIRVNDSDHWMTLKKMTLGLYESNWWWFISGSCGGGASEKHITQFSWKSWTHMKSIFFKPPPIAKGPISTQLRRLILRDSHDGKEGVVPLDSHDVFCCTFSFWRQAIHTGTLRSYDAKKVDPGECWVLRCDSSRWNVSFTIVESCDVYCNNSPY